MQKASRTGSSTAQLMLLRRISVLLWWSGVVLVVSLAVALSAVRLLLPGMSAYKSQIEAMASSHLQRQVEIGSLDAAWQGLSPVLKLQRVSVHGEEFPGGSFDVTEVHLALDVFRSLARQQWSTSRIKVVGAQFSVDHTDGSGSALQSGNDPLAWLSQQERIVVEDVGLHWIDARWFPQGLQLDVASLQLVNEGQRHHLSLQTRLPHSPGSALELVADLHGPGVDPAAWHGRVYLKTQALDLAALPAVTADLGLTVAGHIDLELSAGVDAGRLEQGGGTLQVRRTEINTDTAPAAGFSAERLDSRFRWQMRDGGWQLDLHDFGYQRQRQPVWPASSISIRVTPGEELQLRGGASLIVIDEVRGILPLLSWIDDDALTMMERLQPSGQLHDVEFELAFAADAAPRAALRARFDGLAVSAEAGLPGVSGMTGVIEGNLQSGYLQLDSRHSSLTMPGLFNEPLVLSHLGGTVRWQRYANSFRIQSEAMRVAAGPLDFSARLELEWPYQQVSPWLDLQVASDRLPLDHVRYYLPEKVMRPKAIAWLKEAFDAGVARDVRFLLQGRLDQLPFDHQEGRLEARFDIEDALLDYHPRWGQARELHGSALFVGRSMRITGERALIGDARVQQVEARIDDLQNPLLKIDGAVDGTLQGMLDYVAGSPLGERFGAAIKQFDAGGDAHLQLGLQIPLRRNLGRLGVQGGVSLQDNALAQKTGVVAFSDIDGKLQFTEKGVSARKLDAVLLGKPVQVSVYRKAIGGDSHTLVDVVGRPDLLDVVKTRQPALAPYLNGNASWHALLQVPDQREPGDPDFELQLQSDLVGVAVDLPEPLYKPVDEPRNLLISWASDARASQPMLVSYGDLIDARILPTVDRSGIRKADVRFGSGTAQLPEQQEIRLGGQLKQLDLARWLQLVRAVTKAQPDANRGTTLQLPVSARLAVMDFSLWDYRVKDVRIDSEAQDPWYFTLRGDGAAGTVRWTPATAGQAPRLQLALDKLVLESRYDKPDEGQTHLSKPAELPELAIEIADLHKDDKAFGAISLSGQPLAQGFEFTNLAIKSDAVTLGGHARWMQQGELQNSGVDAEISAGSLEKLVQLFGDSGAIQGGALSGRVKLNWQGDPAAFSLETLEGDIYLKAREGRLEHVDEGAGKLLNLFSLNSLQRRLSLDFSDIVKEGFSFNTMEGRFVLTDGDAFTKDFSIEGSSAIINIAGRTGLIKKDYDQLVTVTPQVSSSLPIAGAIAGGPAVGAAVLLAEKLVGKEFNRMTELQYQVSGSWEEPVYKRLQKNPPAADTATVSP